MACDGMESSVRRIAWIPGRIIISLERLLYRSNQSHTTNNCQSFHFMDWLDGGTSWLDGGAQLTGWKDQLTSLNVKKGNGFTSKLLFYLPPLKSHLCKLSKEGAVCIVVTILHRLHSMWSTLLNAAVADAGEDSSWQKPNYRCFCIANSPSTIYNLHAEENDDNQGGTSCGKLASDWRGPTEFVRTKRLTRLSSVLSMLHFCCWNAKKKLFVCFGIWTEDWGQPG